MAISDKKSLPSIEQLEEMSTIIKNKLSTIGSPTIKVNGTVVSPSADGSVDLTVPTKTSQLTNDSSFATTSQIPTVPTKVSQLTNDSGFQANTIQTIKRNGTALTPDVNKAVDITVPTTVASLTDAASYAKTSSIPTKVSQLSNDSGYGLADDTKMFSATLKASGWTNSSGTYTQTVACTGVTAAMNLEAPQVPATGVKATDEKLKEGLSVLCASGNSGETLAGQIKWTCYGSVPTVDLPLRMRRAKD